MENEQQDDNVEVNGNNGNGNGNGNPNVNNGGVDQLGFAAVLAVLITGTSQSRQHGLKDVPALKLEVPALTSRVCALSYWLVISAFEQIGGSLSTLVVLSVNIFQMTPSKTTSPENFTLRFPTQYKIMSVIVFSCTAEVIYD
ncbi:hypothetical protein Tco_1216808 [Tanacetum coccineum]